MSTRITEPASNLDGASPGDTVLGHSQEVAQAYRDAAAAHRQRQESGIHPAGSPVRSQPPAPPEAPLPMLGVARQVAGKEVNRLKAQAEAGQRDLNGRFTFGWNGQQISDPAVIAMRKELVAQIGATEAEIERLESMDDLAVRQWAFGRGVR